MEEKIQSAIQDTVKKLWNVEIRENIIDSRAKEGDISATAAFVLASTLKKNPNDIANEIVNNLPNIKGVKEVKVAAGYLNFYLDGDVYKNIVNEYSDDFGKHADFKGKKIMIEFGQPNTHKALQMGHFKSAVSGLPLARMYENLGYEVIKANYFGDIGLQVANCLWGILKDKGLTIDSLDDESLATVMSDLKTMVEVRGVDEAAQYLDDCYVNGRKNTKTDPLALEEAKKINSRIYNKEPLVYALYEYTREISIRHQEKAFKQLGVEFDKQYPESTIWELGLKIVKENIGKVFIEDQGAVIFEGDKYGLQRWVFINSEGFPTYSGKDVGLAHKKFEDFPDLEFSIITTSIEQIAYFKAVIKVLELINPDKFKGKYFHKAFGWLLFGNKKMSSKTGNNIKYTQLIAEAREAAKKMVSEEKEYTEEMKDSIAEKVAIGALKFAILSHEFHKDINYDIGKFMSLTGYAAPYVMYSYARANGILNNIGYEYNPNLNIDLSTVLNSESEIELLKKINEYPEINKVAGLKTSPHLLCKYVYELSEAFNKFYGDFNIQNEKDEAIKESRLTLVYITKEVIGKVLYLLGIETIEKM